MGIGFGSRSPSGFVHSDTNRSESPMPAFNPCGWTRNQISFFKGFYPWFWDLIMTHVFVVHLNILFTFRNVISLFIFVCISFDFLGIFSNVSLLSPTCCWSLRVCGDQWDAGLLPLGPERHATSCVVRWCVRRVPPTSSIWSTWRTSRHASATTASPSSRRTVRDEPQPC